MNCGWPAAFIGGTIGTAPAPEGVAPHFLAEFKVAGGGTETTLFTVTGLTFRPGPNSLFAPGGTALLIDVLNPKQTYGRSVACGVISRTEAEHASASLPNGQSESAESAHKLGTGDDMTFRQPQ